METLNITQERKNKRVMGDVGGDKQDYAEDPATKAEVAKKKEEVSENYMI